jgi:hypothetical protein
MKKILFGIFALSVILIFPEVNGKLTPENGKLSGVITYNDSFRAAYLPDAGTGIYVISEADARSTKYKDIINVVGNLQSHKSDYSMATYNTVDPVRIKTARDYYDTASAFTNRYISGFKKLPAVVKAVTNGAGNYTLELKPGRYYLLVVSGSVRSNNVAESKGNIDARTVDITPGTETHQSVTFRKNEMNILIYQVSHANPSGC